ncbi:MAG: cytochrome b/b6 domain-containing protein [Pseudomonadota bacterium]
MSSLEMPSSPASATYGGVTKTFHWLTALLIFTAFPLGVVAYNWPYDTAAALQTKYILFSLHKTVGVSVFFVALARIAWAFSQPKPPLLNAERKLEAWAAETVHWVLYASLVLVPLSGWLHHSATTGFADIWWPFGQSLPFVPVNESVAVFFAGWHEVFTKVLLAAVALHVAGALKHHLIDRDDTLRRMLPGRTAPNVPSIPHGRAPIWSAVVIWAGAIGIGTALGLSHAPQAAQVPQELSAAPTGWAVQEGTLAISVQQGSGVTEGSFGEWTASIEFDPDQPGEVKGFVSVEIAVPSLTLGAVTSQATGTEFLDAQNFPVARFAAEIVALPDGATPYEAFGTLNLRGAEVPVSLPFDLTLEGDTATMVGQTVIDRRDYGIGLPTYSDEGTVGFDVTISVDLTAIRQE